MFHVSSLNFSLILIMFSPISLYSSMANLLDFVVGAAVGTGGQKGILIRIECEFL